MVEIFRHSKITTIIYIKYSNEITLEDALTVRSFYSGEILEKDSLTVYTEITDTGFVVDLNFITEIADLGKSLTPFISKRIFIGLRGIQKNFLKKYQELREDSTENDISVDSISQCEKQFKIDFTNDFQPVTAFSL